MALRGLYVFSHDDALGNVPAHTLFDRLGVEKKDGVDAPRAFDDYDVSGPGSDLPDGVTLTPLIGS
jgi:CRISPR-associated protein Csd2